MSTLSRFIVLALAGAFLVLGGCGYTLHGRVVEGVWSGVEVADGRDAVENGEGVRGAHIAIYRDPNRPSRRLVATGTSAADGTFRISLPDSFGAGWMEEVWLVQVSRQGYTGIEEVVALPIVSANKPLLITLARGRSNPFLEPNDYHRDLELYR